jgi:iterative type I PKS product template protein
MAMTVCDYAYKLVRPGEKNVAMNVSHMQVPKSLIADPEGKSQILRLTAKLDAAKGCADLVFFSGEEGARIEHATCQVLFGNSEKYLADWARHAYLIQSRIDWLQDAEDEGKAHKIGRGLAYKLFAALVDYDHKYRGMEEVILHSENMEATARVVFQTTEKDGNFFCCPYWIDSVAHLAGFIVNGSDAVNSQESVYISHGWESLQVAEPLRADKSYRSYVKMQPQPGKIMAGDVYVFEGDRIVASVGGLKFQCIPRKVLNTLLPPVGTAPRQTAAKKQSTTTPKIPALNRRSAPQVTMENIRAVNEKLTSITSRALDILAVEIGVGLDELVDNVAFSDLGVDSLMTLSVSGRLRDELEINVHSQDFHNDQTIGEFKKVLSRFETNSPVVLSSSDSSGTGTGRSTFTNTSTDSPSSDTTVDEEEDSKTATPVDDSGSERGKESEVTEVIRATIADEMGLKLHEVSDTADLAELGLDSLMSLSILGAVREKTGLSLPADLLTANKSIREIERFLGCDSKPISKPAPRSPRQSESTIITDTVAMESARSATSVLLQGNSRLATKHLWLIPDGGGSATSYVDIPDLSPDVAVWGLNSPFMKVPEEYNIGVVGMAERFITEIKRRQPSGPYILAGWSAGGVIAFEAVNQLIKSSEKVEQLILIDSPCPDIIEPLPSSLHRWFASIGLLGDGDMSRLPSWLLPHFAASVNALSTYTPQKIDLANCPNVTAIWCEDGVCHLPTDPRPDPFPYGHAQFLLDNRTDFGPNLWDNYLDAGKFTCHHMPGNHFSVSFIDLVLFTE